MKNKVQHIISAIALTLVLSYTANAQTTAQKIGKNPTSIAPSAVLDIDSDNKGVLFPRVALTSTTDVTTIASPAEGLTIYNTASAGTAPNNVTPGYYYWNGTKWTKVATEAEASKWSYDAIKSRVYLTNTSKATARPAAKFFGVHDNNILQIGDTTNVVGVSATDKSIVTRKTGNNSILNVSDGGTKSMLANEIYGGTEAASGAYLEMIKHRGTATSPEIVQDGDLVSYFDFKANTGGSATRLGARLRVGVDGAVTTSSTPMRISFETAAPGETAPSLRMSIKSNGYVGIGTLTPVSTFANTSTAIQGSNTTNAINGGFTWSTPGTGFAGAFYSQPTSGNGLLVKIAGTANTNNAFEVATGASQDTFSPTTPLFNVRGNGMVGINNSTPTSVLDVTSTTLATNTVNADVSMLRLLRPTTTSVKSQNIASFNLGSYGTNGSSSSRLDLTLNDVDPTLGATTNVMTWQANGNVGIGTTAPTAQLEVATTATAGAIFRRGATGSGSASNVYIQKTQNTDPNINTAGSGSSDVVGRVIFAMANGTNYPVDGNASIEANYVGVQTASNAGGNLAFKTVQSGSTAITERMRITDVGNLGIGTTTPTSRLEVDGAATNKTAFNAGSSTTIDFSKSNLAYTTANPGNTFTLSNIKDGGTYTLAVQGTTAGTASFTASGFTFKSPNNGLTASTFETLYTFMVIGNKVYFYMTTGL